MLLLLYKLHFKRAQTVIKIRSLGLKSELFWFLWSPNIILFFLFFMFLIRADLSSAAREGGHVWSGASSSKFVKSYLVRRSAPGSQSQSSRTRSGSSLLCRRHCFDRGCSSTVWEAPWSRKAWPRLPSGSRQGGGRPYSVHRWTDPECSPHSRSWVTPSTPRWGTPAPACFLVDLQGKDCHLSPGSRFLQGLCKQYAECWWKWCLKK